MRHESKLKSALLRELHTQLPRFVIIRHADYMTSGIPDFSLTYNITSWWEMKHGIPHFDSEGIQELTCRRLEIAGFCRYIIYLENSRGDQKRTLIVKPRDIKTITPEVECVGHNHRFVVDYIRKVHNV